MAIARLLYLREIRKYAFQKKGTFIICFNTYL